MAWLEDFHRWPTGYRAYVLEWSLHRNGHYTGMVSTPEWSVYWSGQYTGMVSTLQWSVRWSGQYTGLRTERFWIPVLDQEANFSSMPVQEVVFFYLNPVRETTFLSPFRFRKTFYPIPVRETTVLPPSGFRWKFTGNLHPGSRRNFQATSTRVLVVIFRQPPPGFSW